MVDPELVRRLTVVVASLLRASESAALRGYENRRNRQGRRSDELQSSPDTPSVGRNGGRVAKNLLWDYLIHAHDRGAPFDRLRVTINRRTRLRP